MFLFCKLQGCRANTIAKNANQNSLYLVRRNEEGRNGKSKLRIWRREGGRNKNLRSRNRLKDGIVVDNKNLFLRNLSNPALVCKFKL